MLKLLEPSYRLVKQIGEGGFSQTFIAVDETQSPPLPCVIQQISLQYRKLEDLQAKAGRLKQLGNYCQIPKLQTYFDIENDFYLIQEYIEGINLNTQLEQKGTFSEVQIWQILTEILPILKAIHSQNLIHCNIKPENLIFNHIQNNNLYLVNFAASIATTNNHPKNIIANPEYSAPEQTQGKPIFTSDLYSLGVTCIYLLTHISPFYLIDIANTKWVWRDYLQSKVSERLSNILDKLMEKDVSCRFQSVDEVMQAMGITCQTSSIKIKNQNRELDCLDTLKVNSLVKGGIANAVAILNSTILASGNDHKTITIWDLQTKKVLHTLIGHLQPVTSVAFSPDGNILATASDDKTIKLWDAAFQEIFTLNGHTRAVKSIAFSPDGKLLASGSWDKTIKLWDMETKKEICSLTGHQLQISAVAFSPDGQIIASASFDKTIRLWDIPVTLATFGQLKKYPCRIFVGHTWGVLAIAFSPDGKILATGSDDNTIKLWSVNTGEEIATLANHSWSVTALTFDSTGEILISGSKDKTIKLWQVSNREEIATLSGHDDSLTAVAVVPDAARLIASSSKDKTIKLWDFEGIFQKLNT
jgi:serine/threonine protein kinase